MPIPILYSTHHRLHDPQNIRIDGKPFDTEDSVDRAEIILAALQSSGFVRIESPRDFGVGPILAVHDPAYISYLQSVYNENALLKGRPTPVIPETFAPRAARRKPTRFYSLSGYYAFGVGSPILENTWTAAYWSAQCALTAADWLITGERVIYALCRPPGHHAGPDFYGGYCYLNNAAIAARFLSTQVKQGIAILDIDYHHGNGTQEIFYDDPEVLFCSLHAEPDSEYPYFWGGAEETGTGRGLGYNHNWPLPLMLDLNDYLSVLAEALHVIKDFNPAYLVVSTGFDIVSGDPNGSFLIETASLHEIGRWIANLNLPTIIVQEGGYMLNELGKQAVLFLEAFL